MFMTALERMFENIEHPHFINAEIIFTLLLKQKFNIHNQRFMLMFLQYMINIKQTSTKFFDFLLEHEQNEEDSEEENEIKSSY